MGRTTGASPPPRATQSVPVLVTGDRATVPTAKVRDVIRRLEREGWRLLRQRGSHRTDGHPDRPGSRVIVSGGRNEDLAEGTYHQIQVDAGWRS